MAYGTPRAVIADNDVICLRCATRDYLHIPQDEIGGDEISLFVTRAERHEVFDRQREAISLVLEGQHDAYLHTVYCPLCTTPLCPDGCECHAVAASTCPFCLKGFDTDVHINTGHYDQYHGFYVHIECIEIGVLVMQYDNVYHSECFKKNIADSGQKRPIYLQTDDVQHMICCWCDEPLLDEETKSSLFGHDDQCDCETCERVDRYARSHGDQIQIEGYRLAHVDGMSEHGFTHAQDYARFLGYTHAEFARFLQGYSEVRQ